MWSEYSLDPQNPLDGLHLAAKCAHMESMLKKTPKLPGEARLKFGDFEYKVLSPGDFVLCAVTGRKIPLDALRYWSVDLQEAYIDAKSASEHLVAVTKASYAKRRG